MKNLLGINSNCINDQTPDFLETETLKIIKDVGFNGFFTSKFTLKEAEELKLTADKLGLEFFSIHAPFKHINTLWEKGEDYKIVLENLKTSVNTASILGVKTVVVHVSSTWRPPKISKIGLERFKELAEFSKDKKVNLAFENLRVKEYLDVVLKSLKDYKNVGFCYDFGHESCFSAQKNLFLPLYGKMLLATHIHDNFGRTIIDDSIKDDLHYIPLDGDIDYKPIIKGIKELSSSVPLTLEVAKNAKKSYKELSPKEFITLAFNRLKQIINL